MTLVLSQQIETRLVQEARQNGMTPDAYAELLLRRALPDVPPETPNKNEPRRAGSAKGKVIVPDDEENRPRFGSAKGKVTIPDDFDEPLDDFKEYMY